MCKHSELTEEMFLLQVWVNLGPCQVRHCTLMFTTPPPCIGMGSLSPPTQSMFSAGNCHHVWSDNSSTPTYLNKGAKPSTIEHQLLSFLVLSDRIRCLASGTREYVPIRCRHDRPVLLVHQLWTTEGDAMADTYTWSFTCLRNNSLMCAYTRFNLV